MAALGKGPALDPATVPWLNATEAAGYLRLPSVRALYKRVERGQVPACYLGRTLRFRRRDLDRLLGSSPVSAVAEEGGPR